MAWEENQVTGELLCRQPGVALVKQIAVPLLGYSSQTFGHSLEAGILEKKWEAHRVEATEEKHSRDCCSPVLVFLFFYLLPQRKKCATLAREREKTSCLGWYIASTQPSVF